jgi:beta-barrel assembly-enhancing protease
MSKAITAFALLALAALLLCPGCDTVTDLGTAVGQATGTITSEQAQSIKRTAKAVEKTFQDITPEQEYYIGRSVAATVLSTYKPYSGEEANHYLNVLGQCLAQASDKPETFGGYHFQIMESDEVNAFSAPGGYVMISRGLLRCCKSEDAVAAVLAHEIGHVQGAHGLRAIKAGRLTSALTILGTETVKTLAKQDVAELTKAFEGSIGDITSTLVNGGYGRSLEREADAAAVTIMKRVGYDPNALVGMLQEMKKHLKPGGLDFAKTHPKPDDRIADVRKWIGAETARVPPAARQARFEKAVGKL